MSEDELYTTSKVVHSEVLPTEEDSLKNKRRVEDDFFAFHEDAPKHKKKKKKKKSVKSEPLSSSLTRDGSDLDHIAQSSLASTDALPLERKHSTLRDVSPPPAKATHGNDDDIIVIDDDEVGGEQTFDVELQDLDLSDFLDEPVEINSPVKVKNKVGLRDQFHLKVDISATGVDSTLELSATGAKNIQEIINVIREYLSLDLDRELTLLYDGIKLYKASQLCNILLVEKELKKDIDGSYHIEMVLMYAEDYATQQLRSDSVSLEPTQEIDDTQESGTEGKQQGDDDDSRFNDLKLTELEKLASKSLRSGNSLSLPVEGEEPTNSFKITLRSADKQRFDISIHPDMKIEEIKHIALERFQFKDCKLIFDDEELDTDCLVKETELEEDFMVDVSSV